ncbi:MAG TPA: hypothetical protein DFK21_16060 [Salmonella bongori]|nr:hypothetical protein [Salmonella bongori]HCI34974.1 hypothetical protein [Salmonella bongori]HCI36251.1 hypothetical protein [Salmonella bongori]HCI41002.1 hypothetical protein [Salmonella bongori]
MWKRGVTGRCRAQTYQQRQSENGLLHTSPSSGIIFLCFTWWCVCRLFHAGFIPFSRQRNDLTLNLLIKRCNIVLMLKIAGMTVEPQRFGSF